MREKTKMQYKKQDEEFFFEMIFSDERKTSGCCQNCGIFRIVVIPTISFFFVTEKNNTKHHKEKGTGFLETKP